MDASGVGAGIDARELDGAVVGAIGGVGFEDGADEQEEVDVAGNERVVDVRGDGAVERHEVDGIKGGAQGDVGDGEEAGLGEKVEVAASVVFAEHAAVEGPEGVVGLPGLRKRPDVDGFGEAVAL